MKVKDTLSSFEGVAIGRLEYLFGCVRISVQSPELKDGKPIDPIWFDEGQLVEVRQEVPEPVVNTGGPREAPPSRDPVR
jgi:hypothetical protein